MFVSSRLYINRIVLGARTPTDCTQYAWAPISGRLDSAYLPGCHGRPGRRPAGELLPLRLTGGVDNPCLESLALIAGFIYQLSRSTIFYYLSVEWAGYRNRKPTSSSEVHISLHTIWLAGYCKTTRDA